VVQVETKGKLWHFRYPIESEQGRYIVVATTRRRRCSATPASPWHPEDERYKDLVGKYAILPLVRRRIRIVADAYADPATGSGAVKITPAHDFSDFEVGKRQGLPQVDIFDRAANVILRGTRHFWPGSTRR